MNCLSLYRPACQGAIADDAPGRGAGTPRLPRRIHARLPCPPPYDKRGGIVIGWLLRLLALRLFARPVLRLSVGLLAIPAFRFLRRRVFMLHEVDPHLEEDIELWFRGSLVLLVATANMEHFIFGWVAPNWYGEWGWLVVGLRLLLAISVIELMPDQNVFSLLHPGPPRLESLIRNGWKAVWKRRRQLLIDVGCLHLRRSSPVLAIMAAIFGGPPGSQAHLIGWICYSTAVAQFLVIGFITTRDRALANLPEIERRLVQARHEMLENLDLTPEEVKVPRQARHGESECGEKKADTHF